MTERHGIEATVLQQRDAAGVADFMGQRVGDAIEHLALLASGLRAELRRVREDALAQRLDRKLRAHGRTISPPRRRVKRLPADALVDDRSNAELERRVRERRALDRAE